MSEFDDAALERKLRRTLRLHLDGVSLELDPAAIEARGRVQERRRTSRQRWIVLGLAAALALPVAWLAAGAPRPDVPPSSAYEVILARESHSAGDGVAFELVAVRADGRERVVARIPSTIGDRYQVVDLGPLSSTGWLALHVDTASNDGSENLWAFVDLRMPEAPPRVVDAGLSGAIPIGWGPDGRFAISTDLTLRVIAPTSGAQVGIPHFGGTGLSRYWLADGSGFLLANVFGDRPIWRVLRFDGTRSEDVFETPFVDQPLRSQTVDGSGLVGCGGARFRSPACTGLPSQAFVVRRSDGSWETYFGTVEPRRPVRAAMLTPDGHVLGLVDDLSIDRQFVVEQADSPTDRRTFATVPAAIGVRDVWISGVAPDGSMAIIAYDGDNGTGTILAPTGGAPGTYHVGTMLGFLKSDVADSLPGDLFASVLGATAPAVGARPVMPNDEVMGRQLPISDVVLSADQPAAQPAGPTTRDLGLVTFKHSLWVALACLGEGTATVMIPDGNPEEVDCSVGVIHGYGSSRVGTFPVAVTTSSGAAWHLLLSDPPDPTTP